MSVTLTYQPGGTLHASTDAGPVCGERRPAFSVQGAAAATGARAVAVALNDAHLNGRRVCFVCRVQTSMDASDGAA